MTKEDIEKVVDEYDVYTYHLDTVKICAQLVNQALEEAADCVREQFAFDDAIGAQVAMKVAALKIPT